MNFEQAHSRINIASSYYLWWKLQLKNPTSSWRISSPELEGPEWKAHKPPRLTLFYQDMFIYSGKWQESQVFHRYVQRDINRSHLLHKANSAGTVRGDVGSMGGGGTKEDTHCTLSSNTPVLPPLQRKGMMEDTGREGTRGEGWLGPR